MIYKSERYECFLCGNPRSDGHTIISSIKHYKDMMEIPDDLCTMCDGTMNHFHIQLIPRFLYKKRGSKNFTKERKKYIEAKLISKKISQLRIKAIYFSLYLRCMHTAQIINENVNVPIIEKEFLNEIQNGETWKELQIRTCNGLDDIINGSNTEDIVICISSGVNLSGFIILQRLNQIMQIQ